jgi:hypothetical protein
MRAPKFVLDRALDEEEARSCEFKAITSKNPVDTIKNTADEYAVAYLNSRYGGKIYWGVRDADGVVVGVKFSREERDRMRRVVLEKLQAIQPPVPISTYSIQLYPVMAAEDETKALEDLFVVQISIPPGDLKELYYTGGNEVFVKTDSGRKKLTGPQITAELRHRHDLSGARKNQNRVTHSVPNIDVSESGEVLATDHSLESVIYDIWFNVDSGYSPPFSTKIKNDEEGAMWQALEAKRDLTLEEKEKRHQLLDFANFRKRREQRIFEMLDILLRSRFLRAYLSRAEHLTVMKACCSMERFPPTVIPSNFTKLDMIQSYYDGRLTSYAYLSPSEEEDYVQAARKSPFSGHPIELQALSRETICNKALPSILRDIARVKDKLTDKEIEECLDTFGWVVGPG